MTRDICKTWKTLALIVTIGAVSFHSLAAQAAERVVLNQETKVAPTAERDALYATVTMLNNDVEGISMQDEDNEITQDEVELMAPRNEWLDPYPRRIGFTFSAEANVVANYIWRGLYVGGLSLQPALRLNYEGLFVDMWWSLGATNWAFSQFAPEVDVSIGLDRWGLQLYWLHMHYFDGTPYFNNDNAAPGEAGNTSELRAKYRISNRIPLTVMWCTRLTGRDGYMEDGMLKRAYSSYLELKYEFALPYQIGITAAVGLTPWRSMYTSFEGDFAVTNIDIQLSKQWMVDECCFTLAGNVMFNPWRVNKDNIRWNAHNPWEQRLNANITLGIAWKHTTLPKKR